MVRKARLFVDASPLVDTHLSGVGHATYHVVDELSRDEAFTATHRIVLVVPYATRPLLSRWNFNEAVAARSILLPGRLWNWLLKHDTLPWMDLFLGRGAYLFPNFRNWPLLFSRSFTYIHDVAFARFPETVEPPNLAYLRKNVKSWIARTTKVVTVSETSKTEIAAELGVDPSKIVVVPNGVDRTRYRRSDARQVEATKRNLGIAGDYILYVGNVEPRKNLARLIAAYKSLPKEMTDRYRLVIVGSGGWLNEGIVDAIAHAQYEGYRITRPLRFVEDAEIADLYAGARCAVLPSFHEGFGMPVLEALACGTRVVAADLGSIREAGGDLVAYCDPFSVESIAGALERTVGTEPEVDFPSRALRHAENHSWRRTADIIKQLVSSRG
jgi:glycosyltransferase involved in cell wall biosynthesis